MDEKLDRKNTAVVVDSTADLPASLGDDPNLSMVPLNVHFGDEVYKDWIDLDAATFYGKLREADRLPTTSQPSAGAFASTYGGLRERYDRVFSFHLSAELSGTFESAMMGRQGIDGIMVIDTGLVSLGISLLVDRVLAMLDRGTTEAELLAYIERYKRERGFLFNLDTLEYLQKGGRIGRASSLAGALLSIRPLLTIDDGVVTPYKKVRGEKRALAAMQEYFLERTRPGAPVMVGVAHADAPQRMEQVLEAIDDTDRTVDVRFRSDVGPVIGTYAGPGAAAVVFFQE